MPKEHSNTLIIKTFPQSDYFQIWEKMRAFTNNRTSEAPDELWLLEHPPVFTQGLAGKPEHILSTSDIPIVRTDRGGQVTYHGPGQLMIYTLFDLKRLNLDTHHFVIKLEECIIHLLNQYHINAIGNRDAPGIYVNKAKICSIGLRIRRHRSYHGLALNVAMDLTPFNQINPCGFKQLTMTQIHDFAPQVTLDEIKIILPPHFCSIFGYTDSSYRSITEQALLSPNHEKHASSQQDNCHSKTKTPL